MTADCGVKHWILIGQTPVPADLITWALWFEEPGNRRVKETVLLDTVRVSTVFLGLDHRFAGEGPPILFETMAFWLGDSGETGRCATWLQAEQMHETMCRRVVSLRSAWSFFRSKIREWWQLARWDWCDGWKELNEIPLNALESMMRIYRCEPFA